MANRTSKVYFLLFKWQIFRLKYTKFVVSFPEKLLKIVATIGEIFSLKFTKYLSLIHI